MDSTFCSFPLPTPNRAGLYRIRRGLQQLRATLVERTPAADVVAAPRLRLGIQRKELLRVRDAAQRIAADRNQAALDVADIGERRRHQNRLIERTAHRRDAARLVDGRADDGEVQAFAAADIALEDFADMQTRIHGG